jgi:hypothetical protein
MPDHLLPPQFSRLCTARCRNWHHYEVFVHESCALTAELKSHAERIDAPVRRLEQPERADRLTFSVQGTHAIHVSLQLCWWLTFHILNDFAS